MKTLGVVALGTIVWLAAFDGASRARAAACGDHKNQIDEYLNVWNGVAGADITKAISDTGFIRDLKGGVSIHDDPKVFQGGDPSKSLTAQSKLKDHIKHARSLFTAVALKVVATSRTDLGGDDVGSCGVFWSATGKSDKTLQINGLSVLTFDSGGRIASERVTILP